MKFKKLNIEKMQREHCLHKLIGKTVVHNGRGNRRGWVGRISRFGTTDSFSNQDRVEVVFRNGKSQEYTFSWAEKFLLEATHIAQQMLTVKEALLPPIYEPKYIVWALLEAKTQGLFTAIEPMLRLRLTD